VDVTCTVGGTRLSFYVAWPSSAWRFLRVFLPYTFVSFFLFFPLPYYALSLIRSMPWAACVCVVCVTKRFVTARRPIDGADNPTLLSIDETQSTRKKERARARAGERQNSPFHWTEKIYSFISSIHFRYIFRAVLSVSLYILFILSPLHCLIQI